MVSIFAPRHGPSMQKKHAGLPGRKDRRYPMHALARLFEALPALLLAAALLMPAVAVLA
jgi:hypothetical protein